MSREYYGVLFNIKGEYKMRSSVSYNEWGYVNHDEYEKIIPYTMKIILPEYLKMNKLTMVIGLTKPLSKETLDDIIPTNDYYERFRQLMNRKNKVYLWYTSRYNRGIEKRKLNKFSSRTFECNDYLYNIIVSDNSLKTRKISGDDEIKQIIIIPEWDEPWNFEVLNEDEFEVEHGYTFDGKFIPEKDVEILEKGKLKKSMSVDDIVIEEWFNVDTKKSFLIKKETEIINDEEFWKYDYTPDTKLNK